MHSRRPVLTERMLVASLAIVGAAFLMPGAASAASGGSGAPDTPTVNSGGTPGQLSALCTVTAPPAGGTQSCSGVTVTEGATTNGLQISFSTSAGPVCSAASALSVSFIDPSTSQAFAGTLSPPATISFPASGVTAGETVLIYNSSSGEWVLPPSGNVQSASTKAGAIDASLTGDGTFAAERTCASAIPGATVAVTGKPFLGEEILAGALILGGIAALAVVRRRRVAIQA